MADPTATGVVPTVTNAATTAYDNIFGGSNQSLLSAEQQFQNASTQTQIDNMQFQEKIQSQQSAYNNTMQQASENAHEAATAQTYSQDIANARNTLTSSDMQQIK